MTNELFFVCRCPKCKRSSQFPVQRLGQQVKCRHCASLMEAVDSQARSAGELDPIEYWIEFTESGAAAEAESQWKLGLYNTPRPR